MIHVHTFFRFAGETTPNCDSKVVEPAAAAAHLLIILIPVQNGLNMTNTHAHTHAHTHMSQISYHMIDLKAKLMLPIGGRFRCAQTVAVYSSDPPVFLDVGSTQQTVLS